jgi:hypothetical protein
MSSGLVPLRRTRSARFKAKGWRRSHQEVETAVAEHVSAPESEQATQAPTARRNISALRSHSRPLPFLRHDILEASPKYLEGQVSTQVEPLMKPLALSNGEESAKVPAIRRRRGAHQVRADDASQVVAFGSAQGMQV